MPLVQKRESGSFSRFLKVKPSEVFARLCFLMCGVCPFEKIILIMGIVNHNQGLIKKDIRVSFCPPMGVFLFLY